jgi:hypothetical protein
MSLIAPLIGIVYLYGFIWFFKKSLLPIIRVKLDYYLITRQIKEEQKRGSAVH